MAFFAYVPLICKELPDNNKAAYSVQNIDTQLFQNEFVWLYRTLTSVQSVSEH